MSDQLEEDMDKVYELQSDSDALLTMISNARIADASYLSAIKEVSALKSQRDALVAALKGLLLAVEGTAGGHLAADILEGSVVGNARAVLASVQP